MSFKGEYAHYPHAKGYTKCIILIHFIPGKTYTFTQVRIHSDLIKCVSYIKSQTTVFAGPKTGRPTPGFSIFIRSDRPTFVRLFIRSFFFLQRSNFGLYTIIKGQRDKGTTQEHRNIET